MQRVLGMILTAGLLSGCGPQLWSRTELRLPCPCPPESAVAYATQAARALHVTPIFVSNPHRFSATLPNPDRYTVTKLAVAIAPRGASTAEVRVRTESADAAGMRDNEVAEAFAAAFTTALQ